MRRKNLDSEKEIERIIAIVSRLFDKESHVGKEALHLYWADKFIRNENKVKQELSNKKKKEKNLIQSQGKMDGCVCERRKKLSIPVGWER